ncbi:energy transducer TonB [Dyadobacter luteus]|jgi:hypothetical protein|nr:energy transducer TonB [Dyadobacter luteus]
MLLLLLTSFSCLAQKMPVPHKVEAEFPGGTSKMYMFFGKNFKYPEEAIKANVSTGPIWIQLKIDSVGKVRDIRILKSPGFGFNEECVRVIKLMPAWQPAKISGKPVSSIYKFPLQICLE